MKTGLSEWRSRWRIPAVLGITIETERLVVDHVRRENGGSRVLRTMDLPLGADRVVEDPDAAGRELAALLAGQGVRERRCVVCVPPAWALSAAADVPEVAAEDLRSYFELCAEREFPLPTADLHLAHSTYQLPEGGLRATLAALPRKRIEAVRQMLLVAACRPVSISLALDPELAEAHGGESGSLNVLVNGSHVDFIVSAGGGVAALRSVPTHAKTDPSSQQIGRELRITLGRLPKTVRGQVHKARFLGARTVVESLLESTQSQLHLLGLQGMVPLQRDRSADAAHTLPGVARAAAARHLQGQPVLFEFVAPEVTRWQLFRRRYDSRLHRWLAGIVLAGLVLPAVILFARSQIEGNLRREWEQIRPTVAEITSLQDRIRQFRPWFDPAPHGVHAMAGLVAAFPESGEVWARSVELKDDSRVVCAGFARTEAARMEFVDRLRAQPGVANLQTGPVLGENPVQFIVNFTWQRGHHD